MGDAKAAVARLLRTGPRTAVIAVMLLITGVVLWALSAYNSNGQTPADKRWPGIAAALQSGDHAAAMAIVGPAADRGDRDARLLVGLLCVHHLADQCAADQAADYLSAAAKAGNPDAQHALGVALLAQATPETDAALAWLEKAAKAEQVGALYVLGQADLAAGDPAKKRRGAARLTSAAEQGHAPAQLALAAYYEQATPDQRDVEQALRWYEAAAEQGHTIAQTRLGQIHEQGTIVTADPQSAERWYRQAAEAGYTDAQFALGMMYMLGKGVDADYYEGTYWLEQAGDAGSAKAQDALGRAYYQGVGVRKNVKEALRWFTLAAGQGHLVSQHNAAAIYESDVFERNYRRALAWYQKAADAGYGPSMLSLGDLYQYGIGVDADSRLAREWYGRAARSDDPVIARLARGRMSAARAGAEREGVAAFGDDDRLPTAGEFFLALFAIGVVAEMLSSDTGESPASDEWKGKFWCEYDWLQYSVDNTWGSRSPDATGTGVPLRCYNRSGSHWLARGACRKAGWCNTNSSLP